MIKYYRLVFILALIILWTPQLVWSLGNVPPPQLVIWSHSKKKRHSPTPTPTPTPTATSTSTPIPPTPSPSPSPISTPSPSPSPSPTSTPTPQSTPIVLNSTLILTSTNSGQTLSNYVISTITGDCVDLEGVDNVTLENFQIGPCGTNNSTSSSNGIFINGGTGNNVYDSYIHVENRASGCCDTHDGVRISGSSYDFIQGNIIAFNETNIRVDNNSSNITANGNFLLNPNGGTNSRGQQWQSDTSSNVTVENNRTLSCQIGVPAHNGVVLPLYCDSSTLATDSFPYAAVQEDAINFYITNTYTVKNNWVEGGDSPSGQGIEVDYLSNNGTITDNLLKDTGQGCIGPQQGSGLVSGNKCESLTDIDVNQNGIYIFDSYNNGKCGTWTLSNNIIGTLGFTSVTCDPALQSCPFNSYGSSSSCTVINNGGNLFDNGVAPVGGFAGGAYKMLNPIAISNPPPLIPPLPKNCVAKSPYSNQTSMSSCL